MTPRFISPAEYAALSTRDVLPETPAVDAPLTVDSPPVQQAGKLNTAAGFFLAAHPATPELTKARRGINRLCHESKWQHVVPNNNLVKLKESSATLRGHVHTLAKSSPGDFAEVHMSSALRKLEAALALVTPLTIEVQTHFERVMATADFFVLSREVVDWFLFPLMEARDLLFSAPSLSSVGRYLETYEALMSSPCFTSSILHQHQASSYGSKMAEADGRLASLLLLAEADEEAWLRSTP